MSGVDSVQLLFEFWNLFCLYLNICSLTLEWRRTQRENNTDNVAQQIYKPRVMNQTSSIVKHVNTIWITRNPVIQISWMTDHFMENCSPYLSIVSSLYRWGQLGIVHSNILVFWWMMTWVCQGWHKWEFMSRLKADFTHFRFWWTISRIFSHG